MINKEDIKLQGKIMIPKAMVFGLERMGNFRRIWWGGCDTKSGEFGLMARVRASGRRIVVR